MTMWTPASSTTETWTDEASTQVNRRSAFQRSAFQNSAFQVGQGWDIQTGITEIWIPQS